MGSSVFLKVIRSWIIIGMNLNMMLPDPKPNILRHMLISEVDVRQTIWSQHKQWPCKNNCIPLVSYRRNALIISVRVSCAKRLVWLIYVLISTITHPTTPVGFSTTIQYGSFMDRVFFRLSWQFLHGNLLSKDESRTKFGDISGKSIHTTLLTQTSWYNQEPQKGFSHQDAFFQFEGMIYIIYHFCSVRWNLGSSGQ